MQCQICGKKPVVMGLTKKLRGHKNPTGKRKRRPNLQWLNYKGKRIKACTRCFRTISKNKI